MTLTVYKSELCRMGLDFEAAVAAHVAALTAHRGQDCPAPACLSVVAAAVRRVRGPLLDQASARAAYAGHFCESLARQHESELARARQRLEAARKSQGVVSRVRTKVGLDPLAGLAAQVSDLEYSLRELRAGKLPDHYAHLVPASPAPLHDGPDMFVADYEIVDDTR